MPDRIPSGFPESAPPRVATAPAARANDPGVTSPPTPRTLLVDGLRHHKAGRVRKALACYRRAVVLDPGLADGWHMMGAAAMQRGQAEAALVLLDRSRHLSPRDPLLHANLAHAWRAMGYRTEASAALATAITLDPARTEFWQDLGLVTAERRLHRDAEVCLARAAYLHPEPAALVRHANALLALGRRDRADHRLSAALALAPDHLGARLARSDTRRTQGNVEGAVFDARLAVALAPDAAGPAGALAAAHLQGRHLIEAIRWRGRAARLTPGDASAWLALGRTALSLGPEDAAATALKRAIANDPGLAEAYDALAEVHQGQGDTGAARRLLERRLRLSDCPAARMRRALLLPPVPASEASVDSARERLLKEVRALDRRDRDPFPTTNADPLPALTVLPTGLGYQGRDSRTIMERLTRVLRHLYPRLDHTARLAPPPPADSPLRLIVVVPFETSDEDGLTPLVVPLVQDLRARADLVVHVLHTRPAFGIGADILDPITQTIDPADTLPDTLDEARAMIAALRPDGLLAVNPTATPLTWALAFGRLAPVQAVLGACPASTGLPTMDYALTTRCWDSPEAQDRHTERLISLTAPPLRVPTHPPCTLLGRADLGLPSVDSARLYLLPTRPDQLQPAQDAIWIDILRQDPQGLLLLLGGPHRALIAQVMDRWQRHKDTATIIDRVRVLPPLRRGHLLGLARITDCLLDVQGRYPRSVVLEAATLGVPAVTLPAQAPGGRLVAGLYETWGVPELIARDSRHFVNLALRLARHEEWRQELGARLADAAHDQTSGLAVAAEIACFFRAAREAAAEGRRLEAWPTEDTAAEPWAFAAPQELPSDAG